MASWIVPRLPVVSLARVCSRPALSAASPAAAAALQRGLRALSLVAASGGPPVTGGVDSLPPAAAAASAAGAGGEPRRRRGARARGALEFDVVDLRRPVGTAAVKVPKPPKSVARYAESLRLRVERVAAGLASQDKKRADYKKTLPAKGVRKGILQYIKKAAWEKD